MLIDLIPGRGYADSLPCREGCQRSVCRSADTGYSGLGHAPQQRGKGALLMQVDQHGFLFIGKGI